MKRYMDCAEVREDLSAYFDDELNPEERELIGAHLRDCAECLRELDAFKRVDSAYRGLQPVAAPAGFESRLDRTMNAGAGARTPRRGSVPRWAGPLVGLAAAGVVVLGGVLVLESRQSAPSMELAQSAEPALMMQKAEADAPASAPAEAVNRSDGTWEGFVAGGSGARAADEKPGAWNDLVGAPKSPAEDKETAGASVSTEQSGAEEFEGRGDERSMRREMTAASPPPQTEPGKTDDADRAAVLGQPPTTLSPERSRELRDSLAEAERQEAATDSFLQDRANQASNAGEVVSRVKLRSFRVRADGVWYEDGYNNEQTFPLGRESDELRELMKKHPAEDWNKLLKRSSKQIFELDGVWYALDAAPEPE